MSNESDKERYELSHQVRLEMAFYMMIAIGLFVVFHFTRYNPILLHKLALSPRNTSNILGVIAHPFVHGTEIHLYGNLCMFFVLSTMITVSRVNSHLIFVTLYFTTAIMLWLLCDPTKYLIGISAFCFAEAGFLFMSFLFEWSWWSLFVTITALSMYGLVVWNGTFNAQLGVSARGHFIGLVSGLLVAVLLYRIKR